MAQGHDNPDVTSVAWAGQRLAEQVIANLKGLGVVPPTTKVRPNETLDDVLVRMDIHPREFKVGHNDPATMSIVNEVVSGLRATYTDTQPGHTPAPAVVAKPYSVGYPSPMTEQSAGTTLPGGYRVMTQDEDVVLTQTCYNAPLLLQATTEALPSHTLARFIMPLTIADVVSHKNEVYPKEVWESNLQDLRGMAQDNRLLGATDHPEGASTPLSGVSLLFDEVSWAPMRRQDGGWELLGSGYILDTSSGRDLYSMLQVGIPRKSGGSGIPIDVSSRGVGRTARSKWKEHPQDVDVVQSFICKAFDAVYGGASPGASFDKGILKQGADDAPAREPKRLKITRLPRLTIL